MIDFLRKKHILLLHAGGDSKRVPWANPMGKVFLPLPYLAADDPDGPVPLLFDHILAISSCARQAYKNEGGLFIMTGDVLPCFDASSMVLPEDTSCIITVPITLDIASNHGVIVASKTGNSDEIFSVNPVANLLQKPSVQELNKHHAILDDGRTLLDTGIIAVRGKAWEDLVTLACSSQPLISQLLNSRKEMSLYEDLVAAWVPAKHEWLKSRPLGEELVKSLGKQTMYSYCAYDLLFLHFGTSSEVLDHLSGTGSGLVGRRHLCSIPATTMSDIASSAIIISSKVSPDVSIGDNSLVYDSSISSGIQIGSLSVVVGVNLPEKADNFLLPDRHCLWEVPLIGCTERVIVYLSPQSSPPKIIAQNRKGSPPLSPFALPSIQAKNHAYRESPLEYKQKTMLVQETKEKPKTSCTGRRHMSIGGVHKKRWDIEDVDKNTITIAGDNKGAIINITSFVGGNKQIK